jgi:dienelactone hydrolase
MLERFARFPTSLAEKSRTVRLGPTQVPTLLAHPDWAKPAPVMFWMHGRTVNKELDPGRYLRWIRTGIAAVAIDLPGHGERADRAFQHPRDTPHLLAAVLPEIDAVLDALAAPQFEGVFDLNRVALGGMSAGGMATFRRLCDPHRFRCAAVEGATGDLAALFHPDSGRTQQIEIDDDALAPVDAARHLDTFEPLPLLVLHSEADEAVPFACVRAFLDQLRARYEIQGEDPSMIELHTWPTTGAYMEHAGFGRFANEAKKKQVAFLEKHLL